MGNNQFVSESTFSDGQESMFRALKQKQQQQKERKIVNIAMLGSGGSGKTTILNQCCIIYNEPIRAFPVEITARKDLISAVKQLLSVCNGEVEPQNQEAAKLLTKYSRDNALGDGNEELKKYAIQLWKDKHIQEAWLRRRYETWIPDGMGYFLEKFETVMDNSWFPTEYDKVMHTNRTTGVFKTVFRIREDLDMYLWDVGGRGPERKKWSILYEERFHYILFVVNIADYNRKLYETDDGNSSVDSVELFGQIIATEAFQNIPVILIFNKIDLFKEKIMKFGDFNKHFPDYKGAPNDIESIKAFIKEMYMNQLSTFGKLRSVELFPYEINAIDTASVKHFVDIFTEDIY